jgi:hypothetical protein
VTITITGAKLTPSWDRLQAMIGEMLQEKGLLTRIQREDHGVDYRAPGRYSLDYTTEEKVFSILLVVTK